MTPTENTQGSTDSCVLKERMRMGNPLQRMSSERRYALLFFNLFLLAAVLMQLLGVALQERPVAVPVDLPSVQMESDK